MSCALRRPARVGFLVDRHQSHEALQPAYPLLVHRVVFVAQVPSHLAGTEERRLHELLVDPPHQAEVLFGLVLGRLVERRARDRQQLALLADRQVRVVRLDHAAFDFPPQRFSFRSKTGLATASSPTLAWSSVT